MSFVLSKLLWALAKPSNVILISMAVACLYSFSRRPAWGRRLAILCTIWVMAITVLPVGQWLALPLVMHFSKTQELPPEVDGIIVLGGAFDSLSSTVSGAVELNEAADRVTALVALARRYQEAQLVYAGGIGNLTGSRVQPAELARRYYRDQGLDPERITFEPLSRNTWENAVNVQDLIGQRPGETWLLVTSAIHMPRAFGVFQRLGWDVLPYPVDYQLDPLDQTSTYLGRIIQPNVAGSLGEVDAAAKEWLGLVAYWMMDRTDHILPVHTFSETYSTTASSS